MAVRERQTFPLVPRPRLVGLPFGDISSRRRGRGSDVIGTRPYERGDPVSTIDWFASARLSTAAGRDEFVVRHRASDEAPRVAVVCDRRPAMGIYPGSLPWLAKGAALQEATAAIAASAVVARAEIASLDFARGPGDGEPPYWLPPGGRDTPWLVAERQRAATPFNAPDDNVERAFDFLGQLHGDLPTGSFVFVLSDFLLAPPVDDWADAAARGWDLVPVVIQDPTWEQSFPRADSVVLPVVEPGSGEPRPVRLTRREVERRREANEQRLLDLLGGFASHGLDSVLLGSSDPQEIDRAFVEWAELRRQARWTR